MASECILHIPGRLADPSLPVEPGLADQFLQDDAVDVTAPIVAHIDDQALPVEDRIVVAVPTQSGCLLP